MNLTTINVKGADPQRLASLAFEALSSDLNSSGIREILAEIEFAKNFPNIHETLQKRVIDANIKILADRISKHLEKLETSMPEIDKLLILGKVRLISRSEVFQELPIDLKALVFETLKQNRAE